MNTPSEPKILTIGILTFNRSTYLSELLKSITKQKISTLNKIEILILNNGSTDDTNEILKEYENLINLRLIYQSKNVRGSKSYKKLIEQANGEFILFPGDDDVFPESALDNIVIQLNLQSKNVTMIVCCSLVGPRCF